jgi:hypothetical protein
MVGKGFADYLVCSIAFAFSDSGLFREAHMRKLITLFVCFTIMLAAESVWGVNLSGKFAIGAKGGVSSATQSGFSSGDQVKSGHAFGLSAEYFFLRGLSGGLELVNTFFPGKRKSFGYVGWDECRYSTSWNWTSLLLFGRLVLGPERRFSPYLKAGVGLYIPRADDWLYFPGGEEAPPGWPLQDVTFTYKTYGRGQVGYSLGFGVQYLVGRRVLVLLEIPFNVATTSESTISWEDTPTGVGKSHTVGDERYYSGLFLGVSILVGSTGRGGETEQIP